MTATSLAADVLRRYRARWPEIAARSRAMGTRSLLEQISDLPEAKRAALIASITPREWRSLMASPEFTCRPKQLPPPGDWRWWVILAGRGFGKNYAAAAFIRHRVEREGAMAIGLVGAKLGDVIAEMLESPEGGIFAAFPPEHRPTWISRKDNIVSFHTGAIGYCYSSEVPEVRGPNLDTVWMDDVPKWHLPNVPVLFDNVERALRKETTTGARSCGIVTSTPAPIQILRELCADDGAYVVTGATDENTMGLDPSYLRRLDQRVVSSTTAARERRGEMVEDEEGALWTAEIIEDTRVRAAPRLSRVLVCIDPAASTKDTSDLTGIVVVGLGVDGDAYVLSEHSGRYAPEAWGALVVQVYQRCAAFKCSVGVLVEDNRIGDSAAANVRAAMREKKGANAADAMAIVERHAWDSKGVRAEPVATLFRRGRVHIVGELPHLEDEMTTWVPTRQKESPNRIDALVHGVTVLAGLEDDEPEADPRVAFRGLAAAAGAVRQPMAGFSPAALGLPRAAWGSRL